MFSIVAESMSKLAHDILDNVGFTGVHSVVLLGLQEGSKCVYAFEVLRSDCIVPRSAVLQASLQRCRRTTCSCTGGTRTATAGSS